MQFKVITTILLFFVAQAMGTPTGSLQTRDDAVASCALVFIVLCQLEGLKLFMIFLRLRQAKLTM